MIALTWGEIGSAGHNEPAGLVDVELATFGVGGELEFGLDEGAAGG